MEAKKEEVVEPAPSKTEEKAPVETTTAESGEDGWATVEGVKGKPTKETEPVKSEEKETKEKGERKPSKKREPTVVNSRAAMFDSAPDVKRDVSGQFVVGGAILSLICGEFNADLFSFVFYFDASAFDGVPVDQSYTHGFEHILTPPL